MGERHGRPLRIGLDFDDTLMSTRAVVVELLNAAHGTTARLEELTEYYFGGPWKLTERQFTDLFNAHEAHIHGQPPFEGLAETLQAWARRGSLYVVTGRPECWLASAAQWLRRHELKVEEVISARVAAGRTTTDKGAVAKRLKLDFFVEDQDVSAAQVADAGVPVYLLDRPYNQAFVHPNVTRVRDWGEIRERVSTRWMLAAEHPAVGFPGGRAEVAK